MYLSQITIKNFRQFGDGDHQLVLDLKPGVTALIGRNDSGKSAIMDAVRYALTTRDHAYLRVTQEDFHIDRRGRQATEISIVCKLVDLSDSEKGAFLEYLSYENNEVVLYIHWSARPWGSTTGLRRRIDVAVRCGTDGSGPAFETSVRDLLSVTYLKALRDADSELSPGRGSRLSQILSNVEEIRAGEDFDPNQLPENPQVVGRLGLVGLNDYMRYNIERHAGISQTQQALNDEYLNNFMLHDELMKGRINVADGGDEIARLRQVLEKLELGLLEPGFDQALGKYGLGSTNVLFMACELLLLRKEPEGLPLLLVEEPEAHLHPQRQLRLMEFMVTASRDSDDNPRRVQVLMTTHSPNLASKIPLDNMVLIEHGKAFSLASTQTKLSTSDYRFLERFLDVTKANLFFANGVLIVEGDAEAILLPTLAKLIGRDFTLYGVSIVNVGGVGLRRYSKIFQRDSPDQGLIRIPVACITDFDVMPDCAPQILGIVENDEDPKWRSTTRRWKAQRDFGTDGQSQYLQLLQRRSVIMESDFPPVRTFVSDHWTFEYDLARAGLAREVLTSAILAKSDEAISSNRRSIEEVKLEADGQFEESSNIATQDPDLIPSKIYKYFRGEGVSKPIAAQYLAELLLEAFRLGQIDANEFRNRLPRYIIEAVDYVTAPLASREVEREGGAIRVNA